MITFSVEKFDDVVPEIKALTELHWKEIAILQDKIPLDVDWERYRRIEQQGMLHIIAVRDGKELVGYHIGAVSTHLHYKSTLMGMTDIMFLRKDHRTGWNGVRLLQFFEQEMRKLGVKKIVGGSKVHMNIGPLFERLGWTETDRMYTKWIGD